MKNNTELEFRENSQQVKPQPGSSENEAITQGLQLLYLSAVRKNTV